MGSRAFRKKHLQLRLYLQKTVVSILLLCILCLAFWIRIQGAERLPDGQFTENDAYLYHYQANIIAEQGHLPVRDMRRWLPLGRDNEQLLSLYSYTIAYIHKAFPAFSLYQIQLYVPTLCFTLGLSVLLLFLSHTYLLWILMFVPWLYLISPAYRSGYGFSTHLSTLMLVLPLVSKIGKTPFLYIKAPDTILHKNLDKSLHFI